MNIRQFALMIILAGWIVNAGAILFCAARKSELAWSFIMNFFIIGLALELLLW